MARRIALATRNDENVDPYLRALRAAGLEPVTFAPGGGTLPDSVQGLVLTGGTDVDPALYGAEALPETDAPDRERDDYELALLRSALSSDLPVLAICRGQQLFNVGQGGTLIQHLPDLERHQKKSGGVPVHDVALQGRMAEVFGAPRTGVNSRHHQAVDRLGDGLVVTARDSNSATGVIEGFVYPASRFAMGVQWHPEDMADDARQVRLFAAFADSCARND
jgi:gamma-glutamyl-gamma-aminobutyrate hydrolase PuuD